jgi:hypothetical protein
MIIMDFSANNILNKINKRPSKVFSIIVLIFAFFLTYFLVTLQIKVGIVYWDVYLYLNNALMFAGMGEGYKMHLAPMISFITSLFYRYVHVGDGMLFGLCGIIFITGIYGMFLLLKLRFSQLISVAGAVIFASLTIVLSWSVSGTLDVPAACFSIWTIYLTVYGLEKDKRALYLVFPMAAITFLTRYTSGLLILPMMFLFIAHYLENGYKKEDLKKIALGIVMGLLIFAPFMVFFNSAVGTPFPFLDQLDVSVENNISSRDPGLMPDKTYYLIHIPQFISANFRYNGYGAMLNPNQAEVNPISYILLILGGIGLLLYTKGILSKYYNQLKETTKKAASGKRNKHLILLASIIILLVLFIASFWGDSYLITELLMFALIMGLYLAFRKLEIKHLNLDLVMVMFFLTYFISHSLLSVKVDRYFITMAPPMVYLIVLGLNCTGNMMGDLLKRIKTKNIKLNQFLSRKKLLSGLLVMVLAIMLFVSSFNAYEQRVPYAIYGYVEDGAKWLQDYDPDYQDKIIYSNQWPGYSWFLRMNVERGFMPDFNTTDEFSQMLVEGNATYYISINNGSFELKDYEKIGNTSHVFFYKRIT